MGEEERTKEYARAEYRRDRKEKENGTVGDRL